MKLYTDIPYFENNVDPDQLALMKLADQDLHCIPCSLRIHCLFVCFVALRPKSTAMVIAGRSVHLTTLFPGQA